MTVICKCGERFADIPTANRHFCRRCRFCDGGPFLTPGAFFDHMNECAAYARFLDNPAIGPRRS